MRQATATICVPSMMRCPSGKRIGLRCSTVARATNGASHIRKIDKACKDWGECSAASQAAPCNAPATLTSQDRQSVTCRSPIRYTVSVQVPATPKAFQESSAPASGTATRNPTYGSRRRIPLKEQVDVASFFRRQGAVSLRCGAFTRSAVLSVARPTLTLSG